MREADSPHNVEYNKEDPPMTVGSIYPNMAEFKMALRQHAVNVNLSILRRRVHHGGSEAIVKEEMRMIFHGGYMLLQHMLCVL